MKSKDSNIRLPEYLTGAHSLSDVGIDVVSPNERKDRGVIHYVEVEDTIHGWNEDKVGIRKREFLRNAYGIKQPENLLTDSGLEGYQRMKDEGRMVTMIATQVLKPTYYFFTNILMAGELARRGIPSGVLVVDYGDDIFYAGNSDKRGSFGDLKFPVGINPETRELKTNSITVQPYGVVGKKGKVRKISVIDEANGERCSDVLVQVTRALDQKGTHAKYKINSDTDKSEVIVTEAVTGYSYKGHPSARIVENGTKVVMPLPDFYREMFTTVVERLRREGVIPDENTLPVILGKAEYLFNNLMNLAGIPEHTREVLGFGGPPQLKLIDLMKVTGEQIENIRNSTSRLEWWLGVDFRTKNGLGIGLDTREVKRIIAGHNNGVNNSERDHILGLDERTANRILSRVMSARGLAFDKSTGLLYHRESGLPDASSYYGVHTALPDLYFECSSCGGDYFVTKVQRSQKLQDHYELPGIEVRIPDSEIPELEEYCIHPTGRYVRDLKGQINTNLKDKLKGDFQSNKGIIPDLKAQINQEILTEVEKISTDIGKQNGILEESNLVVPHRIAAWYADTVRKINSV